MDKFRLIIFVFFLFPISQVLYGQENERWYAVTIGGSPVGYLLEKNESIEGQDESLTELNISIGRLGSNVKVAG